MLPSGPLRKATGVFSAAKSDWLVTVFAASMVSTWTQSAEKSP